MARKPTKRKAAAAKPKARKAKAKKATRAKTSRAKTARRKTARAKTTRTKAARAKTARRKPARRKPARKKAPARKSAARRTAPKAAASVKPSPTPSGKSDKDHLIDIIQSGTGASKKDAGATLNAVLDTVAASLKKNEKVQLVGFGSFEVARRRARQGRNPATGEPIKIKASKGVRFRAGNKLKSGL